MSVFYFDKSITIRRLHSKGTDRTAFSATFTAYSASLQPTPVNRLNQNSRVGKHYTAYVDHACPIKEGDQVQQGSQIYSVQGVSDYDFSGGSLMHKKVELVI